MTGADRGQLEGIGSAAARVLRSRRARAAALRDWSEAWWWLVSVPIVVALLQLFGSGSEGGWVLGVVALFVALTLPSARALSSFARSLAQRTDARDGLARLDRELAAEGRLQAAHEFLGSAAPTPFMAAAIEDAETVAARAAAHELALDAQTPTPRRAWLAPLAALATSALVALLPSNVRPEVPAPEEDAFVASVPEAARARREREPAGEREAPPTPPQREREAPSSEEGSDARSEERAVSREPEREAKESTGKTGGGRSAESTPTSSSSDSRGFQSSQSQPSQPAEQGKTPQKKPRPPKEREAEAASKKKLDQESGSTAGKGVGSGSSKNPGSTDWDSKDQVSSDEEDPLDDDQEVDDESDESEARGGLQPSLRDRRPAVNRDLTIGFGNQPNPDANGRGGPSEQKKSRGVASLVLGVPIPDHVKGQPNPGRTKITQERVQPRPENAEPLEAAPRTPRAEPAGSLSRRELAPWMRALVRSYFLSIRKQSES